MDVTRLEKAQRIEKRLGEVRMQSEAEFAQLYPAGTFVRCEVGRSSFTGRVEFNAGMYCGFLSLIVTNLKTGKRRRVYVSDLRD